MEQGWFLDLIRSGLFWLDYVIYGLIEIIYKLFIEIAKVNMSEDIVQKFGSRIYALLGIFMLFRVTFSLITYVVDPDKLKDKSVGGGKLVVNILISLALTIITPTIFTYAYKLQAVVLEENILGKIILGMGTNTSIQENAGGQISYVTFSAFFTPDFDECENRLYDGSTRTLTTECTDAIRSDMSDGDTIISSLNNAFQNNQMTDLSTIVNVQKGDGTYAINYRMLISTVAGGFIFWIILMFCLDISLRVVKLGFLQLISPVAIISYIDPKQAKEGLFKKWVGLCGKTYADVFIRLGAIYFAVYIISLVISSDSFVTCDSNGNCASVSWYINIFIILGALMFAKKLPDILKDLLGVDLGGDFTLNPFKKSAGLAALAGGGAGLLGGMVANIAASRASGRGLFKSLGSGIGGAATGLVRGAKAGFSSKGEKVFGSALGAAGKGAQGIYNRAGTSFGGRIGSKLATVAGVKTQADKYDAELKAYDQIASSTKAIKERAKSEFIKDNSVEAIAYKKASAKLDMLKSQSISRSDFTDATGSFDQNAFNAAQEALTNDIYMASQEVINAEKNGISSWVDSHMDDSVVRTEIDKMVTSAKDVSAKDARIASPDISSYNGMKNFSEFAEKRATTIRTSEGYKSATANKNYASSGKSNK